MSVIVIRPGLDGYVAAGTALVPRPPEENLLVFANAGGDYSELMLTCSGDYDSAPDRALSYNPDGAGWVETTVKSVCGGGGGYSALCAFAVSVEVRLDLDGWSHPGSASFSFNCTSDYSVSGSLKGSGLSEGEYAGLFTEGDMGSYPTLVDASGLLLPAATLSGSCYRDMFAGCYRMAKGPALPAEELAERCYSRMFDGCSALSGLDVSFTDWSESIDATYDWLRNAGGGGSALRCPAGLDASNGDASHTNGWSVERK